MVDDCLITSMPKRSLILVKSGIKKIVDRGLSVDETANECILWMVGYTSNSMTSRKLMKALPLVEQAPESF